MVTHYAAMVVIIDVARILIHQVLDVIVPVKHQHQCDDSEFATSTGIQMSLTAMGISLDSGDELLYINLFTTAEGIVASIDYLQSWIVGVRQQQLL